MLLTVLIFLFTLVLVIWQPNDLEIGWSATLGTVLALLTGVMHVPVVWYIIWNAILTFVALILDEAGFFKWAAMHVARWRDGRGAALFAPVILLGAVVVALFASDGTALILMPIALAMLTAPGF